MSKIIRKVLFVTLLLIIPAFLFSGGGKDTTTKPVAIDFWTTETQSDRQAVIQVLIDTFQELNPNITIKLIAVDENDLATQVQTSSAAGNLPALVEVPAEQAVAFGVEGLMDIKATTSLVKEFGKSKFYTGTLKLNESSTKGNYYAIPYHGWVQGIWYRADWFKEAGLDPPTTWENIEKAAKYFYKPEKNQYGILIGTKPEAYTEQCLTQFAMSNGASLFDKGGNLIFNSPQMKETIEYYARLSKYNPPGPQTWRARDYYLQGKLAMFFYSTYIMDDLALQEVAAGSLTAENFAELAGGEFDPDLVKNTRVATIIKNKNPAGYGVVVSLGLFEQEDKEKTKAAQKFIKYLFSPNAYITWLHMAPGGMNPTMKPISTNARFQNDPKGIFKHYGKEKMAEIIQGLDSIETFSIVEGQRIDAASVIFSKQIIPQMIFKITQEGMDIDKAMKWAENEMKKLM
jgi:multiple sugar transport system substrate-binding protein